MISALGALGESPILSCPILFLFHPKLFILLLLLYLMLRPKQNKPFNGTTSKKQPIPSLGKPVLLRGAAASSLTPLTPAQLRAQKFMLIDGKEVLISEYLKRLKLKK
jgi:hypothetical protein